jgi:hypothetical protein
MRLRRGGRHKEATDESAAIAAPAVAVLPRANRATALLPGGARVIGGRGGRSAEPINEWGFYDPDLAGFGALLSTIDTSEIRIPGQVEEDPSDLLLRQQAATAAAPAVTFEPGSPFDVEETPRPSPAASAVASAAWVTLLHCRCGPASVTLTRQLLPALSARLIRCPRT